MTMKKTLIVMAAAICTPIAWAQDEADFVFGAYESDSTLVEDGVPATDSVTSAFDPFAEAVEMDIATDTAQYVPTDDTIDEYAAIDTLGLEEDNDTIRRKLELHPLRKGSYFQFGIGAGISDLLYRVEAGTQYVLPSLTANIGYAYFFLPWMGIGTGAHVSHYGAMAKLTGEYGKDIAAWNGVTDSDGDTYNHRTRMENWKERQVIYMVEIPLALHFQQNWGYRTGLYAQVGAKFGLPVYSDYKVVGGSMRHVGEYPDLNWNIFGVNETAHGFGFEDNAGQNGSTKGLPTAKNNQFRYNIAAFFEIGALFQVSNRVDLLLGVYANYGFTDIDPYGGTIQPNKVEKQDIGFRNADHPFMNEYQGVLATKQAQGKGINGGINALSAGIKFGVNVFAGRTEPKKERAKKPKKNAEPQIIYVYDTIRIQDTIVVSDTILMRDTLQLPNVLGEPVTRQDTIARAATTLEEELRKSVIYFDFDKYDPKLQPADILDKVAAVLVQHRDMGIEVNGHACKTGSDEYNQQLSMKRARAVANMLRQKGVNDSQMKVQSFGSTKPFRYNDFAHQKSKDRRVEIIPVGYVDAETQQQHAAEAQEAGKTDKGMVNKTTREIPLIEMDGKMVPIFLKYTEFIGEVTMKRGMYLAQLSRKWYGGEQAFWVYIYEANMFQIQNPSDIEPGTILMIPKLDPSVGNPNDPECIRKANELKEKYLLK